MNTSDESQRTDSRTKKTYATPVIQVYGNIRSMTNSTMSTGAANDGAATGNKKT